MVYRIYVEKKSELAYEARALFADLHDFLGIATLEDVRVFNRYDVEGIDEALFQEAVKTVFSEPQVDLARTDAPWNPEKEIVFAVEYLPGQFDQRADSAEQCIRLSVPDATPLVKSAKVYLLHGALSEEDIAKIKSYVINPVEAREASLELPETLRIAYETPDKVEILHGFNTMDAAQGEAFIAEHSLAMDLDDLQLCQAYFSKEEGREPTLTEIKVLDTYWSDHCRHTTFMTTLDEVRIEDETVAAAYNEYLEIRKKLHREKPVTLMDMGTIAAKYLKATGDLTDLDESEEINACTVKTSVTVDGKKEPWLLLFKNETHNHPTEIEPFGGAATCIGGAIRDPLSGRSYVYGAMRLTGASSPLVPLEKTRPGKLPQRKLVTTAAAGYSSYGNQIGLATGMVDEIYHPGYEAKHMEVGAVIAAAPAENVLRERPQAGDKVILLGGRTGRDGIGGATGSSKSHTVESLESCGAEVQKGNAPEERKLQRLFRKQDVSRMIKRCNDFGAGGVSVAVGELADGLLIDLDAEPKKYEGLDGTELAISESQERMAVVVAPEDVEVFMAAAAAENLEATVIAEVTDAARLTMQWQGETIVDISRAFLDTNGAEKHARAVVRSAGGSSLGISTSGVTGADADAVPEPVEGPAPASFPARLKSLVSDLRFCSRKGLSERFDSTIGAATVLMPFGGKYQLTPVQAMVHKLPVTHGETDTCSFMSYGFNPYLSEQSPYHGAYLAVVESVAKLIATGASYDHIYLTFQEYFEKLGSDETRWGKPVAALLGALKAQVGLKVAAIGGKDSMSGSFEELDVPPTLISFAVTCGTVDEVVSGEFKKAGNSVVLLQPEYDKDGLPTSESLLRLFDTVTGLLRSGKAVSAYTVTAGGTAEAVFKMALGNGFGVAFDENVGLDALFEAKYGAFVVEMNHALPEPVEGTDGDSRTVPLSPCFLGTVTKEPVFTYGKEAVSLAELQALYEGTLEGVYPTRVGEPDEGSGTLSSKKDSSHSLGMTDGVPEKADGMLEMAVQAVPEPVEGPDGANRIVPMSPATHSPKVLLPVFPGTNCEYDSARAVERAGFTAQIEVIRNLTPDAIAESVTRIAAAIRTSDVVFLPGGFSGADEPDGSGKFITAFFRNEEVRRALEDLLEERDGLMLGICNGFQALIKLGLVPYGRITDTDADAPTLTFNRIARHQSSIVRVRVASNASPWLSGTALGDVYSVPVSHGEGRLIAPEDVLTDLWKKGQIATQYCDLEGNATTDIRFNPNGSMLAAEGLLSPDGRIFGKMGHAERIGEGLYKNVPGNYDMKLFESAYRWLTQ